VAIVTGGGKGIGLGIARELADAGCRVALWDLDEAALRDAAGELAARGADVTAARVDVTSVEQVEAAVLQLAASHGRIDILVNNAGIGGGRLVAKMDLPFWKRVLQISQDSQFICSKAVPTWKRGFRRIGFYRRVAQATRTGATRLQRALS
jgi:3-oxoacyl-[acyl-carrier protein] reductase